MTKKTLLAALLIAVSVVFSACSKTQAQPSGEKKGPPPAPVRVADVTVQDMPVQLSAPGSVEAYNSVNLKPQVAGEITEVHFKEGDTVAQGQRLFTIDPRPYEVALAQAEANLARSKALVDQARANIAKDKAQAANAKAELERNAVLLPKGMVSKEEFDTVQANADALQAAVTASVAAVKSAEEAVRSADADIDEAKLQLSYCAVNSPIDGKTGSLLANKGSIVKANDATLVVINQLQPIYVSFTLPERNLVDIKHHMAERPLEVAAIIPGHESESITGALTFVDNAVNDTGTIRLKATFPNENGLLWPGQFVRVTLKLAVRAGITTVPERAVQVGQDGPYAFVALPDNTVELRFVEPGDTVDGMTEIKSGLQPGETVVTDGQLNLKPGSKINIITDEAAPAADGTPKP